MSEPVAWNSFRTDAPIQLCKTTAISMPIATTMNDTETNLPTSMWMLLSRDREVKERKSYRRPFRRID